MDTVIWDLFFWDLDQMEKLSEIKPPLVGILFLLYLEKLYHMSQLREKPGRQIWRFHWCESIFCIVHNNSENVKFILKNHHDSTRSKMLIRPIFSGSMLLSARDLLTLLEILTQLLFWSNLVPYHMDCKNKPISLSWVYMATQTT